MLCYWLYSFFPSVSYHISLILDIINVALATVRISIEILNDPKIRCNRLALAVRWFHMYPKDCTRVES